MHIWSTGDPTNMAALKQGFLAHNQHIRSVVPSERLLIWHPKDGWDLLCKFLEKDTPAEPVPKVNEGDFTVKIFQYILLLRFKGVAKRMAIVGLPVALGRGFWWWYQRNL